MSNEPTPTEACRSGELDGVLRAFFHAETPNPWPSLKLPNDPVVPAARPAPLGQPSFGRYLALAASVALFGFGAWQLSGQFQGPRWEIRLQSPEARVPKIGEESINVSKDQPASYQFKVIEVPEK